MADTLNKTYTSNITYSGDDLTSTGCAITICEGTKLNDIIGSFYTSICNLTEACSVKISTTDQTCGYLQNKITSNDNSVTITKTTNVINGLVNESLNLSIANRSIILHNDQVLSSITTPNTDIKTFTIPANTFKTNGDMIEWEGLVRTTNGNNSLRFLLGGTSILFNGGGDYTFTPGVITALGYTINVSRVSSTSVSIEAKFRELFYTGAFGSNSEVDAYEFFPYTITSLDLVNNTYTIKTEAINVVSTYSLIQYYNTLKYFPA